MAGMGGKRMVCFRRLDLVSRHLPVKDRPVSHVPLSVACFVGKVSGH
jgi:hypothetical protein